MHLLTMYLAALLIGVIAGLRTFTAPAVVSWAAALGVLQLRHTWLGFLGSGITHWIFTALVLVECVVDQLPTTPSRRTPPQFAGRIVSGALCGAAIGANRGAWVSGLVLGVIGTVIGTLGGADIRARAARMFGRDTPAGIIEDAVAIVGAIVTVAVLA